MADCREGMKIMATVYYVKNSGSFGIFLSCKFMGRKMNGRRFSVNEFENVNKAKNALFSDWGRLKNFNTEKLRVNKLYFINSASNEIFNMD